MRPDADGDMCFVRFLLWLTLATIVVVTGVIFGTGVAGAVMGPAVEARLTGPSPASGADTACPVELQHEVGFDGDLRTYALHAVRVSAPTCPPGTRVSVAIDGRTIGESTVDEGGAARLELTESLPAAGMTNLQVSTVF